MPVVNHYVFDRHSRLQGVLVNLEHNVTNVVC